MSQTLPQLGPLSGLHGSICSFWSLGCLLLNVVTHSIIKWSEKMDSALVWLCRNCGLFENSRSNMFPLWCVDCVINCNSRDPAACCWQRGSSSFHRKNNDSSLPTFATTVLTCASHLRIVPVPVFPVETQNTVFMKYPMHNWAPYWLFTMVYACVPHFNLWQGHKHPCSFQLRIALNLKSTRHYMGIDLVPYVKSHMSTQHNCKI